MRHPRPLGLLSVSVLTIAAASAAADGWVATYHPELEISRAAGEIDVDGDLNDAGWAGQPRARHFAEHNPGDQVQPPVATVALMTYDDEHLYVAYICYDDPALVRASFTERDRIWSDDYVITAIDTYADQSWAYEIACNPLGIQGDLLWSANGGEDMGYDMVFHSAGKVTDEGWQVELAIPWSSLRFPNRDEQVWRVDFWRNHPRDVRGQYSWAAYDRDENCWPCKWGTITGIRGVAPGRGIEIMPSQIFTQYGGRGEDAAWTNEDILGEFSIGARANLSSSFTVEGTYNPDFSQIEADAAQIDVNTTFALSFPERRPFFQEGSDMYTSFFNTVYTRVINAPRYAAKLTGRPGSTSIAYLVARDEHTPLTLPLEERSLFARGGESTSNILRVRHALDGGNYVGLTATDRRIDGGGAGTVVGLDGRWRLSQSMQLEWQALGTRVEEPRDLALNARLQEDYEEDPAGILFDGGKRNAAFDGEIYDGRGIYGSLEIDKSDWGVGLDYWERSPTFRVGNGFEPRNNRRDVSVDASYVWRFDGHPLLEWISPSVNTSRVWNFAGTRKDEWIWAGLSTRLRWAQAWFQLSHMESNELFDGIEFRGIEATALDAQILPGDKVRGGFSVATGHRIARGAQVMGKQNNAMIWIDLKPADRFLFETSWHWIESGNAATGEPLFKGFILRSRWGLQFTRELSARLVIQYDDFNELWEADPLVTYRINPFSTFYCGSTRDYLVIDPENDGIDAWRLTDRQYFMKLQYLFQL
ncbi:carbohydrate binding family 9 domain-containing protein [bacterium]|nr:carbohydrate binding family 9 domain-containing protein [bacterium]MBU1071701.1 carbohydrate binding family 9 domain-containing protein [bacterium]MBU1676479.1 carbohydrate binding family 9 domain-containing protein [bacterium]